MARVLVIGANGQIGKHLVSKIKEKGHDPVAMVRKEEQVSQFKEQDIETVLGDLEKDFSHAFENVDTVVFAAGSGPHTGADKTIIIDQEGAIETIDNTISKGIKNFVMLSGLPVDGPKGTGDGMKPYFYAKYRADQYLQDTDLNYTILRPGLLTDKDETGKVQIVEHDEASSDATSGEVPRADVAEVLAHIVDQNDLKSQIYYLIGGDTDIKDAL
ncbi:SDR family oxidoreductase [Salinicoccus sp. HZC-1]|uniref:SDR family oxidoreductase n=1 Tax=Salinicoccus sp. HZC-1 TaxID=3385497 RepID=UPI00398BA3F3